MHDKRMIAVMQHCIDAELADTQKEFLESIGFHPAALKDVRSGRRSFTVDQIAAACKKYKISADWILGLSTDMRRVKSKDPLQNLKDAVRAISV